MKLSFVLLIIGVVSFAGCYSFTGSSVPSHLKTIAIPLFDDQSGSGEPGLREKLTNKLIEKFRKDNSFEITDKTTADSIIEGIIIAVSDQPQVMAAGETVTTSRVTITVKVTYQDMKLKKKVWDKQFSQWANYEIGLGFQERYNSIEKVNDKLVEDILLETVSGW